MIFKDTTIDDRINAKKLRIRDVIKEMARNGADFFYDDVKITSLEGAPSKIGGDLGATIDISFEEMARNGADFFYDDVKITSLKGAPSKIFED